MIRLVLCLFAIINPKSAFRSGKYIQYSTNFLKLNNSDEINEVFIKSKVPARSSTNNMHLLTSSIIHAFPYHTTIVLKILCSMLRSALF